MVAIGVVVLILCGMQMSKYDYMEKERIRLEYGVILLFCMVSLAAFLFVRTGIVNSSFNKLLQKEDYTPENKEFSKKVGPVAGVYRSLATVIFLAIGFLKEDQGWANAALVWPFAGILFGVLMFFMRWIHQSKESKKNKN